MSYNCEIQNKNPQPTLVIRTQTTVQELAQKMGQAYGAIAQYLGSLGEQPVGAPFGGYFNMDVENLDVEIGFPVSKKLSGQGEIQASEIPGGKLATCLYTGPYSNIESAYGALAKYVAENGREATGISYEFYLNDPTETTPEKLQTQIVFPLK